jgi:ankyrin repeat protein
MYFKLGGYPLMDLKINPELHSDKEFFTNIANLAKKHSHQFSNLNYKTMLHQLVFHPTIPLSIVKSLIGDNSLLKEVLNSRDFEGKTPVMLAVKHGNFAFLDAISESKSIFIKDD